MRNAPLLRTLAAVEAQRTGGGGLCQLAGFDALELTVAIATATRAGFIEPEPAGAEGFALTPAGWAWAAAELAPFMALAPGLSRRHLTVIDGGQHG